MHEVLGCCDLASSVGVRVGMTLSQAAASIDPAAVRARIGDDSAPFLSAPFLSAIGSIRDCGFAGHCHPGQRVLGGASWARRIVALDARLMAIQWDAQLGARALDRLGRCLERWIPVVSTGGSQLGDGSHAAFLLGDFTGCAALFRSRYGTEQRFMRRVGAGFAQRGFRVRLATASTIGAAAGMAGWGTSGGTGRNHDASGARAIPICAIGRGSERAMLGPLPIESLRISAAAAEALRSVEVETVEQLARLGRSGIAARMSGGADRDFSYTTPSGASSPHRTTTSKSQRSGRGGGGGRGRGHGHPPTGRGSGRSSHVASIAWGAIVPQRPGSGPEPSLFDGPATRAHGGKASSRSRLRAVDDVLVRLDQALGVAGIAPEMLSPMCARDPIAEETQFDGPCAQLETVIVAVSALIDRIVRRLHVRREGLRSARLHFRHADLPADLSTDSRACAGRPRRGAIHAGGPPETEIELSVARPTLSRTHLWSVLRPRLETIALDHGVESIHCVVERSVRLRYRELAAVLPEAMTEDGRTAESVSVGPCAAEWIDLVRGRLGGAAVVELPAVPDEADANACRGMVAHRPPIMFARPEPAVLRGGSDARHLAAAVATRTLWRGIGDRRDASACMSDAFEHPSCEWRGLRWCLHSIDGWERIADAWWCRDGSSVRGDPLVDASGRGSKMPASPPMGHMHARIEVDGGLWLFVRWPSHLARGAPPASGVSEDAAPTDPFTRWLDGSAASIERGVALEVLGVWG